MRVRVVLVEAHGLPERGDAARVVAGLDEHQAEVVVGLREIGPEPDGLAERGLHLAATRALATEEKPQHVGGLGAAGAGVGGRAERRGRGDPVRRRPRGRGQVQPGLELSDRLVEIARPQVRDAQIDVDGGGRRQERDRALQARPGSREIARLAQGGAEKRVAVAGRGLGEGPVARAAEPQRDAEAVMSLGGLGPEGHRALEVGEGLGQVLLLAEHEAQDAVGVGMALVEAHRLRERIAGGGELAALDGGDGAAVGLLGRALRIGRAGRRTRSAGLGALLPQGGAERVVGLALLRVELDRLLERGDGTL